MHATICGAVLRVDIFGPYVPVLHSTVFINAANVHRYLGLLSYQASVRMFVTP